ncbi:MAG: tetratricopeptide repeat protein, partial [Candidatus Thorarchaeota archaeon]
MARQSEDLCASIMEKLMAVGVPEEIDPEIIRPRALHSRYRKALTELETLLESALEALKEDKRVPRVLCRLADLHLSEGAFGKAIMDYEVCLGFNSKQPNAWIHMGMAYYLIGEYHDAVSCFGSALAVDKRNIRALTYMGLAQIELGDYIESLKSIEKALILDAKFARALLAKGLYFKKRGKNEGAITWFKRAIESEETF